VVFVCSQRRQGPSPKAVTAVTRRCSWAPLANTPRASTREEGRGWRRFPLPSPGSEELVQVLQALPPPPHNRGEPSAGTGGCAVPAPVRQPVSHHPDSTRGATCQRTSSEPPRKGCRFPAATAAGTLTQPGQGTRGSGPGCSPRHWWGGGRAEASRR